MGIVDRRRLSTEGQARLSAILGTKAKTHIKTHIMRQTPSLSMWAEPPLRTLICIQSGWLFVAATFATKISKSPETERT
jgi:hypothetical protein